MLLPPDRLRDLYNEILKNALTSEGQGTSIYIFISNEIDSLCSLKMLTVSTISLLLMAYSPCPFSLSM